MSSPSQVLAPLTICLLLSQLLLLLLLPISLTAATTTATTTATTDSKTGRIEVDIVSRWESTDIAAEASEFITSIPIAEHGALFWKFIEQYMQRVEEGDCAALSDRDKYDLVMRIADEDLNIRELGGELLVQMMKYALATRYYSPRIETFRQLAVQSVASIDANATLDQHEPIVVVEIANGQEVENQKWRRLARGVSEVEDAIAEALKFDSVGTRSGDHCGQFVINTVYPFDHPYHCSVDTYGMEESSSVCNNGIRVIVYSDLHSKQFLEVHKKLKELICSPGTGGRVQYYFRHFDHASTHTSEQSMTNPLPLQGYGVELIIKNLEYKQMDDSLLKYKEKKKKEKKQDKEDASSSSSQDAKDEVNQDIEGQLKDLGVQIAQYAMDEHSKNNSKSGLVVLQDLVQNFPSYLHRVLKIKPNRDIQKDIVLNQSELGSGSKLMINGIELDLEQLSIFNLLDIVGSEFRWMNKMRSKLHLPSEFVKESILRSLQVTQPAAPLRYDPFLDDEEKTLVTAFINDIEKDDHYQNFPKDLKFMLAPPYFGQMRFSKRNVFQAIYLSDLSQKSSLEMVSAALATYQRGMPAQFGFLFFDSVSLQHHIDNIRLTKQSSTPVLVDISLEGDSLERASNNGISLSAEGYECDRDSATTAFSVAFQFMLSHPQYKRQILPFVFQLVRSTVKSLQPQSVRNVFASVTGRDLEQIMSQNSEFLDVCSKTGQIAIRTGLRKAAPSMLLNGRMFTENDARVQDLINTGIFSFEYAVVKDLIKNDKITDSDEHLPRKILDQFDGVLKRYNPNAQQHSPIFKSILAPDNLRDVPFLTSPRSTQGMDYIFNYFFVLDLHNVAARHLLSRAIDWLSESRSSTRSRIAIIPSRGDDDSAISQAIMDALKVGNWVTVKQTLNAIEQSVAAANDNKHLVTREQILGRLPSENRLTNNHEGLMNLSLYRTTMLRALDFTQHEVQAQQFIILNGQQIALPTDEDLNEFALEDFGTLERVEHARIERICEQFNAHTDFLNIDPDMQTSEWRSNVLLGITSTLGVLHSQGGHRTLLSSEDINFERVAMTFNQASGSLPHVTSIVDPLDEKAQKIMAFTRVLAEHFGLPVTTILNPPLTVEGVPKIQKRWYRFVMDPELQFHESNGSLIEPRAQFDAIPADQNILTMNMHVPETWLIESIYAVEDLDNINLANMIEYSGKESLYARYHLENIIVTGSCNELQGRGSTRGLQLILGDRLHPRLQDTLVMANYGYFQLKASPNVWKMQLAPGRHAQVFQISEYASSSSYDQRQPSQLTLPANGTSATIILDRFDGPFVHLHVEKRKGMENADLFGPADAVENNKSTSGNIWDRVKSVLGGNDESKEEKQRDVINVFSIASGHMYERLMKIMILSVVKNTKRKPVKFWLIKNYISPQFKEFLPRMAERYGFEYEFITYKWPTWLNKQTEKQRLIWAYKILFLDVLFPLDVHKVIYVDADQVTRADLTELWDMDLQGKPLAYTPFCSDRTEMDGYRFWKQGYWKSHLKGKPYHISALYMVDIDRLRSMYGGDQLRFYYDSLSKDPNSLANLDQDLPNYAQHVVPIFSLPQEWLWCETWCSDESKTKAKTIDLCNNPMTKEHKLESARRIISEWEDFDNEIAQLGDELLQRQQ